MMLVHISNHHCFNQEIVLYDKYLAFEYETYGIYCIYY
jgi:hypothetical protein